MERIAVVQGASRSPDKMSVALYPYRRERIGRAIRPARRIRGTRQKANRDADAI